MTLFPFRQWCVLAMVVLSTAVLAAPVAAQEDGGPTPRLSILPTQSVRDSVTSIVPERIGELLREQVSQDTRVELLPSYGDIQNQLGGSTAAIAKAEGMYTSGIGLLTAGDDKQAVESFQRAVELMEQNLGDVTNYDILSDAIANLAIAYFNSGFDLDARKRMQQYAHLRPNETLDPKRFPKELLEVYEEEARKVKSAGPGKLTIETEAEAIVTIDGVEKGTAPVTVEDVGFGTHYLVVRAADGRVFAEKIRVRGRNREQTIEADLSGDGGVAGSGGAAGFYEDLLVRIETGEFSSQELAPYLEEFTKQTTAAHVAWVLMYKKPAGQGYAAVPFAYRASDGRIVQGEEVVFDIELSNLLVGVADLSRSVVDLALSMPDDAVVEAVEVGGPPPEATPPPASTTEPPVAQADPTPGTIAPPTEPPPSGGSNTWTIVAAAAGGLVAVGLVAGGIYLFSNSDGGTPPGFNTEVTW